MVRLVLDDRPGREDGLWIHWVRCQRLAQVLKRLAVQPQSDVQQAYCRQDFWVFRRCFQGLNVNIDSCLVVLLNLEHSSKLYIGVFVFVDLVCLFKVLNGFLVVAQKLAAKAPVEVNFPVRSAQFEALVEDIDRCLVSAQQVQTAAELLQVVGAVGIEHVALFEQIKGLVDPAFDSENQRF